MTAEPVARRARQVLAQHGKSFFWASRLLGPVHGRRLALLYAFCRRIDDLVDEKPAAEARAALAALRRDVAQGASGDPTVAAYLELARETATPIDVVHRFLDGIARDLGPVRIRSEADLLRYAYGVAGTVGLLVCALLGVREERALPFAVDLGVAMQLTNIARDVVEDARRDRVYLPATFVAPQVTPERLLRGDPDALREAAVAAHRVLALADRFYRSADQGMRHLPARARLGILTASRVYEAIGGAVRRRGLPGGRAFVGRGGRLGHTLRALLAFVSPRSWPAGRAPVHDAGLHAALRGLPGTDRAA